MSTTPKISIVFFGSSRFSVIVLDELMKLGHTPSLIITTPDKPQGRKLTLTPNVVKQWAINHNNTFLDPAKLDSTLIERLKYCGSDEPPAADTIGKNQLHIVASYGKIIPSGVINIPQFGMLNIHPSLLPKYRGPSPLGTAILDDEKRTGVTIMKIDEQMDHGPIIAQIPVNITEWPIYEEFEELMARKGAQLLAETIPGWVDGDIVERPQDHSTATYTQKITKEDALIDISDPQADRYQNFRKIQAYHEWPQAYFNTERRGQKIRVKITDATYAGDILTIKKVVPEGAKEMLYEDFVRGLK